MSLPHIPLPSPQARQYLFFVATAAVPVLIAYGLIDTEQAAVWLGLAASVLATGTAGVAVRRQRNDGTFDSDKAAG